VAQKLTTVRPSMIERQIDSPIPMAAGLGCEEGVEQPIPHSRRRSRRRKSVTLASTSCFFLAGSDQKFAWPARDGLHGFDAIHHQVDDGTCLQLDPISQDRGGELVPTPFANDTCWLNTSRCISPTVSLTTSLTSSGTFSMSDFFRERPDPSDHFARAIAVLYYPFPPSGAQRPDREGRGRASADKASAFGDDGGERLVHFMGDGGCQFAQRRHGAFTRASSIWASRRRCSLARSFSSARLWRLGDIAAQRFPTFTGCPVFGSSIRKGRIVDRDRILRS